MVLGYQKWWGDSDARIPRIGRGALARLHSLPPKLGTLSMDTRRRVRNRVLLGMLPAFLLLAAAGCRPFDYYAERVYNPQTAQPPRELAKAALPVYRVEPPDVIQLEVLKVVPRSPYHIETLDVLQISVTGGFPDQPIANYFLVDAEGQIDLGPGYGRIRIVGMTVDEARRSVDAHLRKILRTPEVSLQLARTSSVQAISGNYLIASDGTINLRQYGLVYIAGMTLTEAREAVERQLSQYFDLPKVSVDVVAYNSKIYYIITEGAGNGDNIVRVPVTGNETVLDALSQVQGLSQLSSKRVWIARPAPYDFRCEQILPVDYAAVTRGASVATNYQVLPGDRVFIAEDKNVATSTFLGKVLGPLDRIAGSVGLTATTAQSVNNINTRFNNGNGGGF